MPTVNPAVPAPRSDVPVTIVGGGPVGVVAALLLIRSGVDAIVVERYSSMLAAPKAHLISPRSLEILTGAGVPLERLEELAPARDGNTKAWYVNSLAGRAFGWRPYEPGAERGQFAERVNIAQPILEKALREHLEAIAPGTLRTGHRWISSLTDGDGVLSEIDGPDGSYQLRSAYLIAADGAGSGIRESLGIRMQGPPPPDARATIHFEADLRDVVAGRQGMLYFVGNESTEGTLLAYDPASTWAYLCAPLNPETAEQDAVEIIRAAIGADRPFRIKGISSWTVAAEVAERYADRRTFLVGDAAHRFPPTGGLGLNTGLGDADNLAWKLSAVLRGGAAPALLDTYDSERRPVGEQNRDQSLANLVDLMRVYPTMIGYDEHRDDELLQQTIDRQLAAVNTIGLQLGYRYGGGKEITVLTHEPTAEVGDHVPAVPLAVGGGIRSIIDRTGFSLLVAPGAGAPWRSALARSPLAPRVVEVELAFEDDTWWNALLGLIGEGAVLVRPDAHILGRYASPRESSEVIAAITGLLQTESVH